MNGSEDSAQAFMIVDHLPELDGLVGCCGKVEQGECWCGTNPLKSIISVK